MNAKGYGPWQGRLRLTVVACVVGMASVACSIDESEGDENGESHFLCQSDVDCARLGPTFRCGDGVCVEGTPPMPDEGGDGSSDLDPAANWTMLGYDAASTYHNRAETRITPQNVGQLREAFTIEESEIYGAPLQVDGTLYVGGYGGPNMAVDLETGAVVWRNSDFQTLTSFAYRDGTLYVHEGSDKLRALDAATGKTLWQRQLSAYSTAVAYSSAIIANDTLYVGCSSAEELMDEQPTFRGLVAAYDLSGGLKWQAYTVPEGATGAGVWSSLTVDVAEGRAYATTANNYTEPATDTADAFLAFDVESGEMLWKNQRFAGDVWSQWATGGVGSVDSDYDFGPNPVLFEAIVNGTQTRLVAAGQKSGEFHVLDRSQGGAEVCRRRLSQGSAIGNHGMWNNTSWDGEHLLVAANGAASDAPGSEPPDGTQGQSVLFALDPATCDIAWERQLPGNVFAPITVANGVGFVGAGHHLQAFDVDSGVKLFDYEAPATISSAPTASNGRGAFGAGFTWIGTTSGENLIVLELP